MSDIEKQEHSEPEQTESKDVAENSADSSQSPPKGSQRIAIVALILALAGLVMGYVKWGELNSALQQEIKNLAAVKEQQQQAKGNLDRSNRAISEQQTAFAKQNERMKMQAEEMEQSLELVYERVGGTGTQWLVAEAEYLMRIANHRLQLERDSKTALVALERADKRLHDSGDPIWTPIREKLATEMAALKGLKELDLAGHAAQVSGLVSQVEKLKLPNTVVEEPEEESPNKKKELSFDSVMQDFWQGLKSILKVRRHNQPVSAMLEPDQTFFLYQNLRLQLEGARMAILRRDQLLFDDSVQRIEAWIKQFFAQDDAVTESMLQGVADLSKLELQAEMPDISGSLRMLMEQQGRGDEMPEVVEEGLESTQQEQQVSEQEQPASEESPQPNRTSDSVAENSGQPAGEAAKETANSKENSSEEAATPNDTEVKEEEKAQEQPKEEQEAPKGEQPVAEEQKEGT